MLLSRFENIINRHNAIYVDVGYKIEGHEYEEYSYIKELKSAINSIFNFKNDNMTNFLKYCNHEVYSYLFLQYNENQPLIFMLLKKNKILFY